MLHHEFRIEGSTEPCQTCDLGIGSLTTHQGHLICRHCLKRQALKHKPWADEWVTSRQTETTTHPAPETPLSKLATTLNSDPEETQTRLL